VYILQSSREKDADALPARLGQAYVAALQYNDALRCFHAACNANPANAAAKDGLRRINMILRGLDPDFDDENNDDAEEQEEEEEEVCV
jgi:TolA-binding protein